MSITMYNRCHNLQLLLLLLVGTRIIHGFQSCPSILSRNLLLLNHLELYPTRSQRYQSSFTKQKYLGRDNLRFHTLFVTNIVDTNNNIINSYNQDDITVRRWEQWQTGQRKIHHSMNHYERKSLHDWLNNTIYEEYWENQLPSLMKSIKDIKNDQQSSVILSIDGYTFLGRMAIYKFLIHDFDSLWYNPTITSKTRKSNSTFDNTLSKLWGSNHIHERHWLWSYGAQLDWQYRSLRLSKLFDDTNEVDVVISSNVLEQIKPDDHISTKSWWGYMNFCFSVAILLGAVNAINESINDDNFIQIELDHDSQTLLNYDPACNECILVWQELFTNVYINYNEKVKLDLVDGQLQQNTYDTLRFQFQQEIWKVHTRIIDIALHSNISNDLLMILPIPERKFGLGWARMVDVLAASTFPTDLITIVDDGTGFLPFHVITDEIISKWKNDQNNRSFVDQCHERAVYTTHRLVDMNDKFFNLLVQFWKRIIRTPHEYRKMPQRVNLLVHGSLVDKIIEFGKMILLFIRS